MLNQSIITIVSLAFLFSCSPKKVQENSQSKEVIVTHITTAQKKLAEELGVSINGDVIITLRGDQATIDRLGLVDFLDNDDVIIEGPEDGEINPALFYLARTDFAIPEFLEEHPTYDGRGVLVGGIDDGVSPALPGMQLTSEGKRKFLNRTSSSDLYQFKTKLVGEAGTMNADVSAFTKSYSGVFSKAYEVVLDIETIDDLDGKKLDYNGDKKNEDFHAAVFQTENGLLACFDINNDQQILSDECLRPFSTTGDFIYWNKDNLRELTFEFDSATEMLSFSEGEIAGDSHGEGVASVMTGNKIAGQFDGVAPGAQYLDYDLSQRDKTFSHKAVYSIGTFLRALEWMGKNNAEVVNMSYSLFFASAKSQEFMQKALDALITKYNFVLTFSAGNNGPGLGSLNRGAIYPSDSLVAGAYLNRDLDEIVHGVTGLPEQGSVVYYSSIGPGVHHGAGPTVISPLSSLTHSSGTDGFRAFNGTSSAAPALAGAAAVLISAVKQEGLKVDAGSIVHSLRQSATPLAGVPFVEQGRGLPKLAKALELYKKMIKGESFKDVEIEITGNGEDKISRRGLFYQLSQLNGTTEETINLKGIRSKMAPSISAQELLETIDIDYSHDFLSGARSLWVASSKNRFYLRIDFDEVKKLNLPEVFAEIKLRSKNTGEVLQIIPVTFINDFVFNKPLTVRTDLPAQAGHRQHLSLPLGVQAVAFKIHAGVELTSGVRATFYDNSRKKTQTISGLTPGITYFMQTTEPGLAQFTLARYGGSEKNLDITYDLTPVILSVPSKNFTSYNDLRVLNHSASMGISYGVQKLSAPMVQETGDIKVDTPLEISADITEVGDYELDYTMNFEGMTTYPRLSCLSIKEDQAGKIKKSFGGSMSFSEKEIPGKLSFKCFPFDMTDENIFADLSVYVSINRKHDASEMLHTFLKSGVNMLDFVDLDDSEIQSGSQYKLIIKPLMDHLDGDKSRGVVITDDLMAY